MTHHPGDFSHSGIWMVAAEISIVLAALTFAVHRGYSDHEDSRH